MPWTSPITFLPETVLTAAQMNVHLRDNLLETAPAKASTPGSIFITSARNSINEQAPQYAFIEATETTASHDFTDLETVGPHVTTNVTFGALISLSAQLANTTTGGFSIVAFIVTKPPTTEEEAVDEETVHEPTDERSLLFRVATADQDRSGSYTTFIGVPEPGTYTFMLKYRVTAGTGTFLRRYLTVVPF